MRPVSSRAPRADAVRNRARVLAAAREAFTSEGPDIALDEIARRAGVGAGTVHRHFPTKAALIDAVLADSVNGLVDRARALTTAEDPGAALHGFLVELVTSGAVAHDLADRLGAEAGDVDAAVREPVVALDASLASLLERAQAAGAVRTDVTGLAAVIAAGYAAYVHPDGGSAALAVVLDGLVPR